MGKSKQPYIPLYIGDWLQDTDCLSIDAEGAWLRVVFKCFKSKGGSFTATDDAFARVCKVDTIKFASILLEWQQNDICDIHENDNGTITITSRRIRRDQAISEVKAVSGSTGGSKSQAKRKQKSSKSVADGQANLKQNPDNEYEIDNEIVSDDAIDPESYGKSENYFHGNVPADLQAYADSLQPSVLSSEIWQRKVQADIQAMGYVVSREVACPYPSEHSEEIEGFIDLQASKNDVAIGIELDNRVTTRDSVVKVRTYPAGMVLLRDPKPKDDQKGKYTYGPVVKPKAMVTSSTMGITREEIEEEIFNDFKLMDSFQKENPKIDLKKLWAKCWQWHSVKPSPPVHAWEWKQKLQTFFNNEDVDFRSNATPVTSKSTAIDNLD